MKYAKIILLFIAFFSFTQVKSQCLDSVRVANVATDSMTFYVYAGGNNDTASLLIYNRWGQIVTRVLNDSILQMGHYMFAYHPAGLAIGTYVYAYSSRGCSHNGTVTYLNSTTGIQ